VGAEAAPAEPRPGDLPIELRAGLDVIALQNADAIGRPIGRALGLPRLIEEWRRYGSTGNDREPLVALGFPADALREIVIHSAPQRIVTLQERPCARLLRPIRVSAIDLPLGLSPRAWRRLGYQRSSSVGLFGAGAMAWAIAERALRLLGRPDLADRCRLGMLRSLKTSSIGRFVAVISVRTYRRVDA